MAKAAEVEEKRKQSVAIINQERALEMQMQRLLIGNGNNLRVFKQCRHGMELESRRHGMELESPGPGPGPGVRNFAEKPWRHSRGDNTSFDNGDGGDYIKAMFLFCLEDLPTSSRINLCG